MRRLIISAIVSAACLGAYASDDNQPTLADLAWMTGAWAGSVGPEGSPVLEERWNEPKNGTLASLVRMTNPDGTTGFVELIIIEEVDGTLVLGLQQFAASFTPLSSGPQRMPLAEIGERTVTFIADEMPEDGGGLKRLTYSNPVEDEFHLSVLLAEGQTFAAVLYRQ